MSTMTVVTLEMLIFEMMMLDQLGRITIAAKTNGIAVAHRLDEDVV